MSATLEIAGQVLNLPVDQLGRISFCLDGYAGESALFELKAPGYLNYTLDIQQLTSGSLPSTIELLADPTTEKPPDCSNGGVSYYVVTGERTREELEDNKLFISQNVTKDLIIEVRTDSGCEVSFLNPPNLLGEGELTVPVDRKVAENGFAELEVTYTAPAASTAPNDPIVAQLKFSLRLDGSESQVQFSPADLEIEVQ